MSRNFELLQAVERLQDFFAPVAKPSDTEHAPAITKRSFAETVGADAELLKLVQHVFLAGTNGDARKRVLFCGVEEGSESSHVCAQAARILAEQVSAGVCVVDAGVCAPPTDSSLQKVPQQPRPNLSFVSAKSFGASGDEAASAEAVRSKISSLRNDFDYVLIDAPPLTSRGEAILLGKQVDGIILVIEAHRTRRAAARRAKEALDAANVRLLGTVLNNRTFPVPEKLYRKL